MPSPLLLALLLVTLLLFVVGRAFQHGADPIVRYGVVNDPILAGKLYGNTLVIVVRGDVV